MLRAMFWQVDLKVFSTDCDLIHESRWTSTQGHNNNPNLTTLTPTSPAQIPVRGIKHGPLAWWAAATRLAHCQCISHFMVRMTKDSTFLPSFMQLGSLLQRHAGIGNENKIGKLMPEWQAGHKVRNQTSTAYQTQGQQSDTTQLSNETAIRQASETRD